MRPDGGWASRGERTQLARARISADVSIVLRGLAIVASTVPIRPPLSASCTYRAEAPGFYCAGFGSSAGLK